MAWIASLAAAAMLTPAPAAAQYSASYTFIQGVKDRDFADVSGVLGQPGSAVIDTRDRDTGDGALHIVTRARDTEWLLYLLRAEANPNLRNRDGDAPLHIAAQMGYPEGTRWLLVVEATVDATNNRGETPLILAVQQHNTEVVRQLIDAGANPDLTDNVIGMSARDYARRDARGASILAILDSARPARNATPVGPTP
ncbi:MAG: ankyrin repeat domain-containing protein [Sphingomonadaceae bacterium]|nr:ankyrin repeat domain-containing protein [Sphingomonadaceae bacterium]